MAIQESEICLCSGIIIRMVNIYTSTEASFETSKYKLGMESFHYFGHFKNVPLTYPTFIS